MRPVLTPLVVVCIEDRDRLRILLEYRTANFDRATIGRFGDRLRQTLRTMVLHPDLAIGEIDFVLPSELARWRDEWAAADEDGHLPTALERFARCVDAAPDAAAVRCRGEIVSYRSLSESSAVMAAHLVEAGLGPGSVIAICAERSPEVVAAMLAVWRVGAAFVPIDPALPARRVSVMCAAARVDAVLTEERYLDVFAEARPRPELLLLGADGIRASDGDQTRRAVSHGDDDRAYIIFTSGTSGEPKGVEVTHENLANLIGAMVREPGIGADDVVLAHTTLSFDISMVEIVVPLSVGATIELLTREEATDPSAVMERLATVTVAQATPTMWRALIASGWEGQPHLRVLCGGEGLPVDLTEQLWDRCAELWNMYGPTETTVWSTVARLDVIDSDVPIGHAIDRTRLYVLDDRGRLVPEGVAGELWIAGAGVARGYAGRDDLTAERFRRDPFVPSGRMYRTGDLVRRRVADGELVCLGRADDQIKLRGHRIELGEVEAVMRSFTDVGDAAATIKSYGPTDQRLIAYLTPARSDSPPSVEEVRTWLAEQLPTYMRPSSIVQLEELPRTANGKLDRARLPLPESPIGDLDTVSGEEAAPHDPSDETEELVAQLFCRVLSIDSVPRDVSFFDLGGHSLLATELIAALRERLGVEVPIATLFAAPTVATLSKRIDANEVAHRWTSLVPVQPSGDGTPFFYVAPFLITAASFTYMGRAFRDRRPFYVLQPQGFDGTATGHTTVEAMASHYIGEMRSVQAAGPYLIGGHCAGATVAFEVAHQLHESGEMVDLLVLVDAEPPHVRRPIGGIRRLRGQISLYAREGRLLEAVKWSARVAYERVVLTRFGNRYVRNTAAIRREHAQAHSRYEPGRYDGSALLIRSAEWSASPEFDWHFRWRELLGGDLVVDSLEGTHAGLVDRSQSARLADRILTAINDRQVAPRQA